MPRKTADSPDRFKRDLYRGRLNRFLSIANDEDFLTLIWAIDALQSGREAVAAPFISYPPDAVDSKIGSNYFIPQWEAETLVNELFLVPKASYSPKILNCRDFNGIAGPTNSLRKLEDAESAFALERIDILSELPRIAQRQFHWQRGYMNQPQFYRWHYLFSGPNCQKYFREKFGIATADLALVGFALYSAYLSTPAVRLPVQIAELGLTEEMVGAALAVIAVDSNTARSLAARIRIHGNGVAYQPSVLRRAPIIAFGKRLRAPLIELVLSRVTAGIYYDIVGGPSGLTNEIGTKFAEYSAVFLRGELSGSEICSEYRYSSKAKPFDTPDIMVRRSGNVELVIECKAKKMTFEASFSENPLEDARVGFGELTKGVFQIWRFFSHIRRKILPDVSVSPSALGIVLTLDNWLTASSDQADKILEQAKIMSRDQDSEITDDDMKDVIFCTIEDLESTICHGTEDEFFSTIRSASESRFRGWMLGLIRQELFGRGGSRYPLHARLGELLPWWDVLEEQARRRGD